MAVVVAEAGGTEGVRSPEHVTRMTSPFLSDPTVVSFVMGMGVGDDDVTSASAVMDEGVTAGRLDDEDDDVDDASVRVAASSVFKPARPPETAHSAVTVCRVV